MEKKSLRINLEDLPEDLKSLPEDAEIIWNDHDDMQDDEFWESVDKQNND